jgi:oligoribonuclease NrnB/cAMP/cGMP phosphodiesterase (DHH superfamily)
MITQIITRPDFDGVVCAVLLKEALGTDLPVKWAQPNQIQDGTVITDQNDVVANLPMNRKCGLWFDHHVSNEIAGSFNGIFRVAPSAAGLVFEYFHEKLRPRFDLLVEQADKIDSAQLNLDEIRFPEKYPHILLSMTIRAAKASDLDYCDHLIELLRTLAIDQVLADEAVRQRCKDVIKANQAYFSQLMDHTRVQAEISITDFRGQSPVPDGNRFLVYSLFPETVANIKIFNEGPRTVVKLGHSIVNRGCRVNVGRLLATYGGGGHIGAGACRLPNTIAEQSLKEIMDIMAQNRPQENLKTS